MSVRTFPDVSFLNKACGKTKGALNQGQLTHLLCQGDRRAGRENKLLACLVDVITCHSHIRGVRRCIHGGCQQFKVLMEERNAPGFIELLGKN